MKKEVIELIKKIDGVMSVGQLEQGSNQLIVNLYDITHCRRYIEEEEEKEIIDITLNVDLNETFERKHSRSAEEDDTIVRGRTRYVYRNYEWIPIGSFEKVECGKSTLNAIFIPTTSFRWHGATNTRSGRVLQQLWKTDGGIKKWQDVPESNE